MANHFAQDLQRVSLQLIQLSGAVEQMIDQAADALIKLNHKAALAVIAMDSQIDQSEVQIEESCLTLLALHQPVAADLRRLTMIMKINNDLEQMADLACNIAERTKSITGGLVGELPKLLARMAAMVREMVTDSMNAFIESCGDKALQVLRADDRVDALNGEIIETLEQTLSQEPSLVSDLLHCFSASRHLEQIADHATSISEDVIYMVSGDIVRHRRPFSSDNPHAEK